MWTGRAILRSSTRPSLFVLYCLRVSRTTRFDGNNERHTRVSFVNVPTRRGVSNLTYNGIELVSRLRHLPIHENLTRTIRRHPTPYKGVRNGNENVYHVLAMRKDYGTTRPRLSTIARNDRTNTRTMRNVPTIRTTTLRMTNARDRQPNQRILRQRVSRHTIRLQNEHVTRRLRYHLTIRRDEFTLVTKNRDHTQGANRRNDDRASYTKANVFRRQTTKRKL